MRPSLTLLAALLAVLALSGCTGAALPAEGAPSASPGPEPGVRFVLDATSEQPVVVVVTDMTYNSVLEGTLERGETLSAPLPPGDYRYRAAQIFEPLEPTVCYQSVHEGTFTVGDTLQQITLFNGVLPGCSSP